MLGFHCCMGFSLDSVSGLLIEVAYSFFFFLTLRWLTLVENLL